MSLIKFPLNNKTRILQNEQRERRNVAILMGLVVFVFMSLTCYCFWVELQIVNEELKDCSQRLESNKDACGAQTQH